MLGESGVAFATGTTTTTDGTNQPVSQLASFNIADGSPTWTYQAPLGNTVTMITATSGNGIVAKTTDINQNDAVIRGDSSGNMMPDYWTSTGYKQINFVGSDVFVGNASGGAATIIASGEDADFAFSIWAKPQPDNRADPKIKVKLTVSNVYRTSPEDIISNEAVTTLVNSAKNFWWKKAQIILDWDSSITPVKSCDPILYPLGCGDSPQQDIADLTSHFTRLYGSRGKTWSQAGADRIYIPLKEIKMKAKNLLLILLTIGSMGLFGESNIPCKPPKEVLEIYLNAGEQGKLLTADGWNKASQAFVHPKPFPVNSGFVIVSAKSAAIETFLEDNKVQETVMGYQNLGRVDSQLRYFPPNKTPYVETGVVYRLVLIEKYQRSNTNETKTRLPESACWKIEDTQGPPWAPLAVAIQHVTSIRDKSSNAKVKKNADETLAMLMQLQ